MLTLNANFIMISMSKFDKTALKYQYTWPVKKTILSPTFLDDDLIDVTNGYDVLNFINRFFVVHNLISDTSFTRLEYLIRHHLPININSRKDITAWIKKNWDREFYGN